jgi:hypothetical protein
MSLGFCLGRSTASRWRTPGHWVKVYQELIEFCVVTLARPEWSLEAAHLQRRLTHYRRRLIRWQQEVPQADVSRG